MSKGWIGVDFDGTLARTLTWSGYNDGGVGEPLWPMVERVKRWLEEGREVRILTARVGDGAHPKHLENINKFCMEVFGRLLPVTASKDFGMIELWDDRAVQVEPNTGEPTTYWVSRA